MRPPKDSRQRQPRRRGFDDDNFYGNAPPPPVFPSFAPPPSSAPQLQATVKWYNPDKGFGFVELADGSGDVFLHANALQASGFQQVSQGATLQVRVGQGQKGRQVEQVLSVDESTASSAPAARPWSAPRRWRLRRRRWRSGGRLPLPTPAAPADGYRPRCRDDRDGEVV